MSSELQEKQRTLEIQERLKAMSPYLQALLEAHDGNDWLQAAVRREEERRAKQVGPVSMQDPRYLASLIGWDPVAGAPFADSDRGDARKLSGIFIDLAHSNRKWWPGSDRRAERIVERLLARAHNERLRAGDAHRTEIADRRELPGVRVYRDRAGRRSAHETSAADTGRPSGAPRDSASPAKPAPTTGRPSTSSAQETRVAASASRRDGRLRRIATITVVVVALILLVPAGLYLALRNDPREKRAREALAVGVLAQTRDVGRVDLNESESARVLDKTGEIELDLHEDGGALRSDLACVESRAWRLTEQETIEVCVLVEPDSGRMLGSFERMQSEPMVGVDCKGQAVADEVRCRER